MSLYIVREVAKLKNRFETSDPFRIIKSLGIELMYDETFSKLKGFYTIINRQAYIVINGNLSDDKTRIIAAHELGHHVLHKKKASKKIMHEYGLYDMTVRTEYEANCFAAELLIDTEDIVQLIKDEYNMEQISALLHVDVDLVGIKLTNLNLEGGQYNIGIIPNGEFLKK